jgi:hypothetical protein
MLSLCDDQTVSTTAVLRLRARETASRSLIEKPGISSNGEGRSRIPNAPLPDAFQITLIFY